MTDQLEVPLHPSDCPPLTASSAPPPYPPATHSFTAARAQLELAQRDPWLASLLMRGICAAACSLAQALRALLDLPRRLRRGLARAWALSLPAAALLFALTGRPARADTIDVTGTGGTHCTLASAITAANTNATSGNCIHSGAPGEDTIALVNGGTYSYVTALPAVTSQVTLQANGGVIQRLGLAAFSVLTVTNGDLELRDATITGGSASTGGGIRSQGSNLTLVGCTITGNLASTDGGGIYAQGSAVNIDYSTISDNSAGVGGGLSLGTANTVAIRDSTISGNSASDGGGIRALLSDLDVTGTTFEGNTATYAGGALLQFYCSTSIANSTLSGNSAAYGGGVFHLYDLGDTTLQMANSTLSGNSADYGAGLLLRLSSADLVNSVIAGSQGGGDCYIFDDGSFSGGNNLIGSTTGPCTAIRIGAATGLDPVLAGNGGPTFTHALLTGSNAIDTGSANCPTPGGGALATDQRGVARPQDGNGDSTAVCDIGAFEAEAPVIAAGDCNGDAEIDAADLSAIALEIFDGDGMLAEDAPGGAFPGAPSGCDANGDDQIDAADLSCAVLLVFNGPGACVLPFE